MSSKRKKPSRAPSDNPYAELERTFHEPGRLAMVSTLAAARDGRAFTELRDSCELTDGNASRHLKALEAAGVVRISKSFHDNRPRTTVHMTAAGRESFLRYLEALEDVLERASKAARGTKKPARSKKPMRRSAPEPA